MVRMAKGFNHRFNFILTFRYTNFSREGNMKRFLMLVLGGSLLLLSACTKEDGGGGTISTTAISGMEAKYSTTDGIIPFPNNILFAGSTDGTLNITSGVTDPADITNPTVALNTLDGFSTVAPISTTFAAPIDETTIAAGVRVFEVTTAGVLASYAVTGITSELTMGTQFVALASPSSSNVLVVKPTMALKDNTNYMVVVTSALKSTSGEAARPSAFFSLLTGSTPLVDSSNVSQVPGRDDATAAQLEGLRKLTNAMLAVSGSASPAIAATDVAVAWSFKTQTLGKVLAKIQTNSLIVANPYTAATNFLFAATTPNPAAPPAGTGGLGTVDFYTFASQVAVAAGSTALLDSYTASPSSFDRIGSVVLGAVKLPYYLDAAANANDTAPLSSTFQVDSYGSPTTKSVETVPFLMTIPKGAAPAALGGKWPVVIFQHGFTVDKKVVFGIANSLSKAGFAVIAIDAVLHGDRTFGLDLVNNTTSAAGPDGTADSSGTHYLNLTSLLTSRDNIRQSVADLIYLTRLLEVQTMDVVNNTTGLPALGGDGTPDLIVGAAPVAYVGHSNGGILGTVLAGVEPAIKTFALVNPGGDYASILQGSGAFSPVVNAGLSAKGVTVGSADYNSYFVAAQTIVDDGDPLNYATAAVIAGKKILLQKTLDDGVVPNTQTDNLSLALNLPQVAATVASASWPLGVNASPFVGSGFTFFTQGTHSSVLSPSPANLTGLDIITEMQSEIANFLGSALLPSTATVVIGATALPSTNAASSVVQ